MTNSTTTKEALEPCPLSHYVHAGLRAHKTGLDPRIVCLDCGLTLRAPDWIKVYERWQSRPRVSAPIVAPVVDGISWSALLSVLERLKSKTRNPDAEWYHGWNAAIQCLINDINGRSRAPASPAAVRDEATPSDVDRLLFRLAAKDCERLAAGMSDCTEDLPFTDWCVVCQSRGLLQKYARSAPPSTLAKAAAEEILNYFGCRVDTMQDDHQAIAAIIERCLAGESEDQ